MEGYPAGPKFVGHGIYISNRTKRAYFINHGDYKTAKSFVDVAAIEGDDLHSIRLRHVLRIDSPLFTYAGINDVVEGRSQEEVYVSIWRHYPQTQQEPAFGHANENAMVRNMLLNKMFGINGKLGVLRCAQSASGNWACERAVSGLVSANGLTVSPNRSVLLVSCPECSAVFPYSIGTAGELTQMAPPIILPSLPDNIEWHEDSDLIVYGGIPVPTSPHFGDVVTFPASAVLAQQPPTFTPILRHDGSKLRQFSAGTQYGEAVLVGSPFANGLLYCGHPSP